MKLNWHVVYTKAGCELKVSQLLTRKHIENYCPFHQAVNRYTGATKRSFEPLFKCYVFVCINESELSTLLDIPGVLSYVYWLNKPATVDEQEIKWLIKLSKEYKNLVLEKCAIGLHQSVIICKPETDDNNESFPENSLKIALPSLGYYITAKPFNAKKAYF